MYKQVVIGRLIVDKTPLRKGSALMTSGVLEYAQVDGAKVEMVQIMMRDCIPCEGWVTIEISDFPRALEKRLKNCRQPRLLL